MATLADRILAVSGVTREQAEHLRSLCSSWQVLADLSFSDLFLYVPSKEGEGFEVAAQLRPFTSQTLYPRDMVGVRVDQPEHPIVERAFREGRIWSQDAPVLVDGVPVRLDALPVRHRGKVVGVVTKEGSPGTSRRPGRLEQVYLEAAEGVSVMIADGTFPWPGPSPGEWPRVGDGLFILDDAGRVTWASPNALSALRRLGVRQDVLGAELDPLGFPDRPVEQAFARSMLVDGEASRGDTYIRLRAMPLIKDGRATGALALAKDVTELRQKDRVISVKDATIREIHHRVKNNLQTIASLLRLQGRRLNSEEAKAALQESVLRIGSIALVHETLSENPSDVAEFGEVARRISKMVGDGLISSDRRVSIEVIGSAGALSADIATPLAVTVTELIQNAIEHAFPPASDGKVTVSLDRRAGEMSVVVTDDGVGIEDGALSGSRLGLQIVRSLIEELGGTFDIRSDGGTRAEVRVPVGEAEEGIR